MGYNLVPEPPANTMPFIVRILLGQSTIAVHLSEEEQIQSGVYDDLIRISVGIEDIEDLKADFASAISSTTE